MNKTISMTTILVIAILLTSCDSGKPLTTYKIEGALPDTFGDYSKVNVVRNSGGSMVSEVTGFYKSSNSAPMAIGETGEIRITIEDWGNSEGTARLPVATDSEHFDYRGLKCYPGFPPGSKSYQVRIPVGQRMMVKIEFDDVGTHNEMEVVQAINWDYLASIHPTWDGLE